MQSGAHLPVSPSSLATGVGHDDPQKRCVNVAGIAGGGQEEVPVTEKTDLLHRVTIADIALRAGVSKGAVSYALNGRPGISEVTRQRILKIADDLGWYPNSAARALSGARAGACGLVLARPARTLAFEPFFMELIAGIEAELSRRSIGLTLQVAHDVEAEMAIYHRWWAERRVDGVLVVDPRLEDPRIKQIERLGLPAVVIGGPDGIGGLSAVSSDDAGAIVDVVRYLARLGHERIARVAGVPEFLSTEVRTEAYVATVMELSLPPRVVTTDFMAESGARVTRQLPRTRSRRRPSSTTARCSPSPDWVQPMRWASRSRVTSPWSPGTTPPTVRWSTLRSPQ